MSSDDPYHFGSGSARSANPFCHAILRGNRAEVPAIEASRVRTRIPLGPWPWTRLEMLGEPYMIDLKKGRIGHLIVPST